MQVLHYHLICAYCAWVLIEVNVAFADLYLLMEIREKDFYLPEKKLNCLLTWNQLLLLIESLISMRSSEETVKKNICHEPSVYHSSMLKIGSSPFNIDLRNSIQNIWQDGPGTLPTVTGINLCWWLHSVCTCVDLTRDQQCDFFFSCFWCKWFLNTSLSSCILKWEEILSLLFSGGELWPLL